MNVKVGVTYMRNNVDYHMSTDFTSLLEAAYDFDAINSSEFSLATTEDIHMDATLVDESYAKTNVEKI